MKEQKNHRHLHFRTVEEAGTHPQTGTPFNAIANETMNLSSSNPHLIHVTFTAITKVIAAVLIGAYSSSAIPSRFTTLRDFRLLLTAVLLPALTIASTAKSIHPHTLIECSVFVWMSVVLTGLGSGLAALFQHCFYHPHRSGGCNARASGGSPTGVPANFAKDVELRLRYDEVEEEEVPSRTPTTTREHHRKKKKKKGIPYVAVKVSAAWRRAGVSGRDIVPHLTAPDSDTDYNLGYAWASYIAFSVFDTITLPLSLLKSLSESVSWIDFSTGSAYTFIFSIFPTVYAWTAGVYFVKRAKRETKKRMMIRLLLQEHLTRRHLSDAATQTAAECGVEAASCELHPYDWERAGLLRLYPSRGAVESASDEEECEVAAEEDSTVRSVGVLLDSPGTAAVPSPTFRLNQPLHSPPPTPEGHRTPQPSTRAKVWAATRHQTMLLLQNPPFMAILVGMAIGLIPFLRPLFFDGGPLELLMDATALIGQGNIPCALVMLGANLAGTGGMAAGGEESEADHPLRGLGCRLRRSGETWLRNAATNTVEEPAPQPMSDQHRAASAASEVERVEECFVVRWAYDAEQRRVRCSASDVVLLHLQTPRGRGCRSVGPAAVALEEMEPRPATSLDRVLEMTSLKGISTFFVCAVIFVRLFVMPLVCFLLLIALVQTMPFLFGGRGKEDLTMIIILFVEFGTPTAINSAIIFAQEEFMTYHWSKMLFLQYLVSIPSLVLWTWLGLRYTEGLAAERAALQ